MANVVIRNAAPYCLFVRLLALGFHSQEGETNFCLVLAAVIWDFPSFTAHWFSIVATSGDAWECQETFLVITTGEKLLASCRKRPEELPDDIQDSPPQPGFLWPQMSSVPEMRDLAHS